MATTDTPAADLALALAAARAALAALSLTAPPDRTEELERVVAKAALRRRRVSEKAAPPATCDTILAELKAHARRPWIFELILPAVAPVAAEVTRERNGAPLDAVARYAARTFAARAAADGAYLALVTAPERAAARAEFRRLCVRGNTFCDPGPFADIARKQAERVAKRGRFRPFQLPPEDIMTGALLAFARRRADDDFAPNLTPENRQEAGYVFWAFCGLTALQLRARQVRGARNLVLVDEFAHAAPEPALPPEREDIRLRVTLDAATRVLSRAEREVLDAFRAGKPPAVIAGERGSTVIAVQKHRSRAVGKIQRVALERVSRDAVLPDVWDLVCAVRAEFECIVTTARAAASRPNAVEVTKEMLGLAQDRVAAARGLAPEFVRRKIEFACRTAFPGAPADGFEPDEVS